jgi:threonyl-tRNA synthetase
MTENYAGDFPFWLAAEQIRLLPVTDDVRPWAEALQSRLAAAGVRASVDRSGDRLGKLIRTGEQQKIPVLAVIGEREAEAGGASLRSRRDGDLGLVPATVLIQAAVAANQGRAAGLPLKGASATESLTVSAP